MCLLRWHLVETPLQIYIRGLNSTRLNEQACLTPGQPDLWESLLEGLLPGSEWCSGALEASGGRLCVRSPAPRGSLLLLLRPLGGLAHGSDSWSQGELARQQIRCDGWGLLERLSSICNADVAAKEVALLITGALGRVADPRELMLCSPRAQLLPLLGQRLESFFRSFGTLSPSLLGCLLEEHRVTLQLPNPPGAASSSGIFPTMALIPEANADATANCEMRFKQGALTVRGSVYQICLLTIGPYSPKALNPNMGALLITNTILAAPYYHYL